MKLREVAEKSNQSLVRSFGSVAALTLVGATALAQTPGSLAAAPQVIQQVDKTQRTKLTGHVRPNAARLPDLGPVDDALPLSFFLLLKRDAARQADLDNLIARQLQPGAVEYHHWLTPQQFGQRFGASPKDISTITNWLQSEGFQVVGVANGGTFIQFKGTAGQIRQSFSSQLRNVSAQGGVYPTSLQDPAIPAALAPAVSGIVGLDRIPARSNLVKSRPAVTQFKPASAQAVSATLYNANIAPQSFYTIYDVNRVFSASPGGLNDLGAESSVAVIEESDMEYGTVAADTGVATGGDVVAFRNLFSVPGTLNMHVYHGYGSVTCNAPGMNPNGGGEDIEASLDAEWANATAPSANLIFMSCDSNPDNGIISSLAAVIDNNLADTISMSYGTSDLNMYPAFYAQMDGFYQQAAAQGQSVFIASGDSGSDSTDPIGSVPGQSGLSVNAFAASPLVTATGGTDFQDFWDGMLGGLPESTYWASTSSAYIFTALSYVPEKTWNDNCGDSLLVRWAGYTGAGWCAYAEGYPLYPASGGGFSSYYPVPAYQAGIPGYSGLQRALPDISGFASNDDSGHSLIYCASRYGDTCLTTANGDVQGGIGLAGGTSFVAPYMAGIGALLNTYTGSRQGLLNPTLYALAKAQFTASATSNACFANGQAVNNGITTGLPASTCIFHDVTTSNNDVACSAGSVDCYVDSGAAVGLLSLTGATSLTMAYPATPGYDESTGIGSVDVYNLLTNWNKAFTSSTSLSASATVIANTGSTVLTARVLTAPPNGFVGTAPTLTGSISFAAGAASLGNCTLSAASCSLTVSGSLLKPGTNSITATFQGSPAYASSVSSPLTVTVNVTGPVISAVSVSNVTNTSAIITWKTDQNSTSQVNYGTTPSYGLSSPLSLSLVTSHSGTLTGLVEGTTYDFAVVSTNSAGASSTSSNYTFLTPSNSATYLGLDTTTKGTWTSTYGANGYIIANDATNPPAYAKVSFTGQSATTWASRTTDPRALQIARGSSSRIASTYYAARTFSINLNLTDGNAHKISLYLLDWDAQNRAETISILDATTHAVLSTQSFSGFKNGEYPSWNIKGNVILQVSLTGGRNAVVAGIFFE